MTKRHFVNLAGVKDCDAQIIKELTEAGVEVFSLDFEDITKHEVPYKTIGFLGFNKNFKEEIEHIKNRPNDQSSILKIILNSDIIKTLDACSFSFTRQWRYWSVSGYVPIEIASDIYVLNESRKLGIRAAGHAGDLHPSELVSKTKIMGKHYIDTYHIDTQEGLNEFVKFLDRYKLF